MSENHTLKVNSTERVEVTAPDWAVVTVKNRGPDTVYYDDAATVSASSNDGSIASGSTIAFTATKHFISAGRSRLLVTVPDRFEALEGRIPTYSVEQFGAVGDGATDDTAAIQAALTHAGDVGGAVVYLPAGTYVVSSTLTFPGGTTQPSVVLRGDGANTTFISYTGTGYAFTIGDASANDQRWQYIENIALRGTVSADGGVKFEQTRYCGIRRCDIRDFTKAGAIGAWVMPNPGSTGANYYAEFETVAFENIPIGIKLEGHASGVGANSNHVYRCHFATHSSYAIYVAGGDTNRITHNEFASGIGTAVYLDGNAAYNAILYNQFDGPTNGVNISVSTVSQTKLWGNTGGSYTVSDSGASTLRLDHAALTAKASVYNTVAQSIANTSITTLTWDSENYDTGSIHSTSADTDRLTVPVAGVYLISVQVTFAANATGLRMVRLTKNGTATILGEDSHPTTAAEATTLNLTTQASLAANDYVICRVYQTSGGALDVNGGKAPGSQFHITRIA